MFAISEIYVFQDERCKYWHICFTNDTTQDYKEDELKIVKSVLSDEGAKSVYDYLCQSATLCALKGDDDQKLLPQQYDKLENFVGDDTALAVYLDPETRVISKHWIFTPIFPFGCNASQFKAVKNAFKNQISVIEGPPGTGKTQTILNIIANLLLFRKTVQVVSNNNTAVKNIQEKLASEKYQMDFMTAVLGNTGNKKAFIMGQSGEYPNFDSWHDPSAETSDFNNKFNAISVQLNTIFAEQEQLAIVKQELKNLEIEQKHFEEYWRESTLSDIKIKTKKLLQSTQIMDVWQSCQRALALRSFRSFFIWLKPGVLYGVSDWRFYCRDNEKAVAAIQKLFYQTKTAELQEEVSTLEKQLENVNAKAPIDTFTQMSMQCLKNALYERYAHKAERRIFEEDDLWKEANEVLEEYPIVFSTTFSSHNSLCRVKPFDYVIMDEASQVDISTGALAFSSARNAVIVGDTKQLPNVVSENDAKRADAIFNFFQISESYHFAHKSFLKSVCEVIPNVPRTLLREHYRCHPKIINFCNQKFYNGKLIIMTEDNGEPDVLSVVKTPVGNHARGHLNQRQIDIINREILPNLSFLPEEIGVIAPYNEQVNALRSALPSDIPVATVHKFQGREKDAILLTTVDDEITDFTDNPYLLNVAISRAKKKLCLVVSGNAQQTDSNIADLVSYVEYNNFSVTDSKLYSVFDYLYGQYTQERLAYLQRHKRVSEYNSENLMYALITDTLQELHISDWRVICHQPLNMLIRNPHLLSEAECQYVMNSATHLDFLIYNHISKKPVLAVEVDGYVYHKKGTKQAHRDAMKNHILELYAIPYIRFATNGSGEKEKLVQIMREIRKGSAGTTNNRPTKSF